MARYLVTGGCGFIGSHLVESLMRRGDAVVVLDDLSSGKRENLSPGARLEVGDIRDQALVERLMGHVDGCFHLAAVASVQRCTDAWRESHAVNLSASVGIMEAAARRGVPVVYASSAAVYGEPRALPIKEDHPTRPLSAYGADKLGCELHARVGGVANGLRSVGLRFFNVYGPRQDPRSPYSGVISVFADRLARGEGITVHGDGSQVRDFVFVGDVVRFLVAGMSQADSRGRVLNVCTGRPTSIIALAEAIAGLVGRRLLVAYGPTRTGDISVSVGNPSAAQSCLGIVAETGLRDGLSRLLRSIPASSMAAAA
ncbi:MAG: NAD-dependent epimerase/dehydratase family protein [Alphaproteobacteria bacterium]|nr:NAD-dependent epimerase/dehydratase family protein [Alphaproteobacteria bacterium]